MNLGLGLTAPTRKPASAVRITSPRTMPRAIELAVTAVALGTLGHLLGGAVVSPVIVLPALVPLLVLARLCAKSELSGRAITAYLVGGQLWVHTLASLTGHHASTHPSSMLTGHAIATVIAVLIIRRREAAAWAKARRQALTSYITRLLHLLVPVPVHEPERIDISVLSSGFVPLSAVLGQSVVRRGPPLGLN